MPNKKISDYTAASSLGSSDTFEVVQSGANKKVLLSVLKSSLVDASAALSGTIWDISANPVRELSLTGNTALTTTNAVNGKSRGILLVTANGHTLTINGTSVTLGSGETWVNVIVKSDGTLSIVAENAIGAGSGGSTTLNAPTGVTLGTATSSTQPITWTDTNTSPNEVSYKVQQSPAGAGTWTDSTMTGLSSTGATVTGLTSSTSYDYRVIAVGDGTTTANSSPSSTVTGSTAAGSSYDTDAQAFFTAAVITNTTQKDAVNQLVLDLKSAGLWTNMKAVYPFVGGTASQHSYNLRNTAQYQITWAGSGVTHDANGVDFDGSAGYGNTNAAAGTVTANNSISFGTYLRQIGALANSYDMGTYAGSGNNGLAFSQNQAGQAFILDNAGNAAITTGVAGLYVLTTDTLANGGSRLWNNGSYLNGSGAAEACTATTNYFIGALTATFGYSNRQTAFAFIYNGVLDATQNSALYTAIQTFQTSLSRNV